jgi:hypothetical protein
VARPAALPQPGVRQVQEQKMAKVQQSSTM